MLANEVSHSWLKLSVSHPNRPVFRHAEFADGHEDVQVMQGVRIFDLVYLDIRLRQSRMRRTDSLVVRHDAQLCNRILPSLPRICFDNFPPDRFDDLAKLSNGIFKLNCLNSVVGQVNGR